MTFIKTIALQGFRTYKAGVVRLLPAAALRLAEDASRLRKLEALNTIHEDAFIGYFIRYRLKCTINGTIKYSHRKRANCTKQLKWIERQAR